MIALIFLAKATKAKTRTNAVSEYVIDVKLIPIGDSPRNKPTSPSKPKLKATDNTNCSTKSSLLLPVNKMLTRQYPGRKETKMKAKK